MIETIGKLREELSSVISGLKDGTIDTKTATEINNAAGKMINSCKVQLEYAALQKKEPKIKFLNCE